MSEFVTVACPACKRPLLDTFAGGAVLRVGGKELYVLECRVKCRCGNVLRYAAGVTIPARAEEPGEEVICEPSVKNATS